MRGIVISLCLAACGSGAVATQEPAKSPAPAATSAASGAAIGTATEPVAPKPEPAPASCRQPDDYGWGGAVITETDVRYCVGREGDHRTCWRFDPASNSLAPLAIDHALDGSGVKVPAVWDSPPSAPTAGATDHVSICSPTGCSDFAVPPTGEITSVAVDPAGARVAVVRGGKTVEIFDRATGALTGSAKTGGCPKLYGFAGDAAVVGLWCTSQGDDGRVLLAPTGKRIAKLDGMYGNEGFGPLGGDRWAFHEMATKRLHVIDVKTGKAEGDLLVPTHDGLGDFVAFANDAVYTYTANGQVAKFTSETPKQLVTVASSQAPTCKPSRG